MDTCLSMFYLHNKNNDPFNRPNTLQTCLKQPRHISNGRHDTHCTIITVASPTTIQRKGMRVQTPSTVHHTHWTSRSCTFGLSRQEATSIAYDKFCDISIT